MSESEDYRPGFPNMDEIPSPPPEDEFEESDRSARDLNFHSDRNVGWGILDEMGYEYD